MTKIFESFKSINEKKVTIKSKTYVFPLRVDSSGNKIKIVDKQNKEFKFDLNQEEDALLFVRIFNKVI